MTKETEEQKIEQEVEQVEHGIDTLSKITFMDSLLDKQTEIRNLLDVRSNIVIGFNSALIVILVTYFRQSIVENPVLMILLGVLVASLLLAIIALKPPHFSTKKGQKESLFYHHYIDERSLEDYRTQIHGVLRDENQIYDAYITEVFNITKYSNIPRKLYLYSSLRVLIYGIGFVSLIYGIDFIFKLLIK